MRLRSDTDNSNNADCAFVLSAWRGEDETATEALLPIIQWNDQRNSKSDSRTVSSSTD